MTRTRLRVEAGPFSWQADCFIARADGRIDWLDRANQCVPVQSRYRVLRTGA